MAGHAAKFADRLLAHTQQATPIFPKNKRTIIREAQIQTTTNPMQDRNFGMFRGQWSTLGKGPSVLVANSARKRVKVETGFVVAQATFQDSPKASPSYMF